MSDRITLNPDICNGRPVVAGTRIAVQTVLGFLAASDSVEDVLAEYPALTRADVQACLDYATPSIPPCGTRLRGCVAFMSVAEIKTQTDALSFDELSDLARHLRMLALCKDPQRQAQLQSAQASGDWLSQAEFERKLTELDRSEQ